MKEKEKPQGSEEKYRHEVLFTKEQIQKRVKDLAQKIHKDYQNKDLLVVGVLKGAFVFVSDLIRELDELGLRDLEIDFIGVSSYGSGKESSKSPQITKDTDTNMENRHVLLVEDITDTGYSLDTLLKVLRLRNPKSLKICALLSKPSRREVEVPIDYLGFKIPNVWVEGYGLDTDQKNRGIKDIVYRIPTKP